MNNLDSWFKRAFGGNDASEGNSSKEGDKSKPSSGSNSRRKTQSNNKSRKPNSNFSADGRPRRRKPTGNGEQKPHRKTDNRSRSSQSGSSRNHSARSNSSNKNTPHRSAPKRGTKPVAAKPKAPAPIHHGKVRIIPIGGLNEVGKNMTAFEFEDDIIIVDIGFEFPSEDMLGVDYVIPDVSYLEDKVDRIRGVILTHGHLDHIGGIPYILPKLNYPPVYSLPLTLGLVEKKLEEFKILKQSKLIKITSDDILKLGKFRCSFARVMHSIPDCMAVLIETPLGKIFHTGDFKFDDTPARNIQPADIHKLEKLAEKNIDVLLCESTNALKPGHSMSEKAVGETLDRIVAETDGRLIIASFSSQIGRLQQVIDAAKKHGRQIYVSGRSMRDNIDISIRLGYITAPPNFIQDIKQYKNQKNENVLILTTGSQGEAVSALSRMSRGEHQHLRIQKGDTIVFSSSPIIGNEKNVNTVINKLTILGANVIHNQIADVHTSGHGKQDELARMINYAKPKYLAPIHGEYYMRHGLTVMAKERCNIKDEQVIMLQNGGVLELDKNGARPAKDSVEAKYVLIDGTGEGRMDSFVQADREIMSQNGALVVLIYVSRKTKKLTRRPEVVSRGFMYMDEAREIVSEIIQTAENAYKKILGKNPGADRKLLKKYVRQSVDSYTRKELQRRPLIVPLIIEDSHK